jgi:alpha-tubulin suppressor-like RCC1 family protein
MVGGNKDYPTAFALKTDGSLYSWGYNGAAKGICLVNNLTDATINTPTQCYNFEIKDVVTNARFIYSNDNTAKDTAQFGYIDDKYNFYLGGYSTEADIPDFNNNIPYFRKYNMKGITTDVNLNNAEAVIHRSNGTVYRVDRYGPKKLF